MIKNIKSVGVLVAICSIIALLLALTNQITAPIIEKNSAAAANAALLEVMPEGTGFELVDMGNYTFPATVTEVHKETSGKGYVIKLTTTGYGTGMVIMCGVTTDGTVTGAVCLSSNETLGKEKEYGANFAGKDAAGVEATDTIGGATMTTGAYKNAIKDALTSVKVLGGENVDVRTPEQILADNLAAALPAGEGKFTKLFFTEVIESVDAAYSADNGAGYVAVIGEEFIGIEAGAPTAYPAIADAIEAMAKSTPTVVDLTAYADIHKNITSVKKTATGNYVLEVKGAGYGIVGGNEYHPASGEYILIRVAMTADGKIIDTLTLSQAETPNLGSVCGDESFYGRFDGKTESEIDGVEGIAGATMTTKGYKDALLRCFAAVTIIEGGAE